MRQSLFLSFCVAVLLLAVCSRLQATPTENVSFRVLPAAKIAVDGKADDWDLSGGIFACDDVEEQRDHFAVWLHAAYDAEYLYILVRWTDETPLNNPGQTVADYGFAGDCLQFRTLTATGTPQERGQHFTAWKGCDGADVIKVEQGKDFKEGVIEDAKKTGGAKQAFSIDKDGKGYVQEVAVPWKLITRDGRPITAGGSFQLTFEPNFTVGAKGRATLKDLFKSGITPDRVFTFMSSQSWGTATLEAKGNVKPQAVRLADAREFTVTMDKGAPVIDWTGLIRSKELPGFLPITFTMPEDGYISLNITSARGQVVRQLLSAAFFTKGPHEVKWDGLTTPSWTRPGEPAPAGDYRYSAIEHPGLGLKLRGWACNGGVAPWDSADGKGNWGGDHGIPIAVAADASQVYLGWSGAEAGKAVLACDLQGRVQWSNNRGGIAGVKALAADEGVLYILGGMAGPESEGANLYKLSAKDGSYLKWEGSDSADVKIAALWAADAAAKPEKAAAVAAADGKLFLSFTAENLIAVIDAKTGKFLHATGVPGPGALAVHGGMLYYLSGDRRIERLTLDGKDPGSVRRRGPRSGEAKVVALAFGKDAIYEGRSEPLHDIAVAADETAEVRGTIGRQGGRALLGPWQADGMRFIQSMAVDAEGKLWVVESDGVPKRISVWDPKSGKLVYEFFGPSSYGALGGAILPSDPDVMVGQGCEWRLDKTTGRAKITAVITRDGMENARFAKGANGRTYLAIAQSWAFDVKPVKIFERLGDADYKLRAVFRYEGKDKTAKTILWTDDNGDGQEQSDEIASVDGTVRFSGWYMNLAPELTIYADTQQFKATGFTACGAPKYDLNHPAKLPTAGLGSADGRLILRGGDYGQEHTLFTCSEIASGQVRWTYPDNFNGVHGSHAAPPPTVGLIRGSFGPAGTAKLPPPIGNVWVIATNVGEWHILTEEGFYLTKLFEGDPLKVKWPDSAERGADMSRTPPGMGGEDFGGSIACSADGKLYVQAGKTAFWNLEVTGLDRVKAISGGSVKVSADDTVKALALQEQQKQATVGTRRMAVKKMSPKFSGNLEGDFQGAEIVKFQKQEETAVRAAAAWDDATLYLAWEVRDATPWVNGAEAAEQLYLSGDTVDFQLGLDVKSDPKRGQAAAGDLRVSIGNFKGQPAAVLYREVADKKEPMVFSSGVIKEFKVDCVRVLSDAKIHAAKGGGSYVIEAAIPLADLGLKPADGLMLRGDFGATHGDGAGKRTRLRSYWSNQHTGLVDDAVFELKLEPQYWGEITFR